MTKKKKKPIFEKVGLVFRTPVRAEIMKELSEKPQRPKDIAKNIKMEKQNLNYHLNQLKKGGLVKTHVERVPENKLKKIKGARIDGLSKDGKVKLSYGVELTKNGKNIVNQFIDQLYEEEESPNQKEMNKNKKLEDD